MALQTTIFLLVTLMVIIATSARDIPMSDNPTLNLEKKYAEDSSNITPNDCWAALSELRACSNEIIGFFLNGQTEIDTPCCHSIHIIMEHCWPAMMGVLGFSVEEGKLLVGYCDKSAGPSGLPPVSF